MLARLLHSVVARPAVYDAVQWLAGARAVKKRVASFVPNLSPGSTVVDIGGGTGAFRSLWQADCRYLCLDLDPLKLQGFRAKFPDPAVQADATRLPLKDASVDAATCTLVSHHLDDARLPHLFDEVARILRPGGVFVFADAQWRSARPISRLMWRYDRGAHPRSGESLRAMISKRLTIERAEDFAVWHRYIACTARRS
jgi:ubiquinone/menaquinone biosynthesis C-methylase UbiE